jgi:hypothetical protein
LRPATYIALIVVAAVAAPAAAVAQRRPEEQALLYRWVDEHGVVHYTDSIPPEYANTDRAILNDQGVRVGFEEGEITEAERAELDRRDAAENARRQDRLDAARRDRMLLETYGSVKDIEDLRDRRLELLESQIKVTELYLANLRKRLATLEEEAQRYKPHAESADAEELPENLALDMSRTTASIDLYEQTLTRTRVDQDRLRSAFEQDIVRFKELKGG